MSKKNSIYPAMSKNSRTRKGTPPNHSKKMPVVGSGRNRPAKGYNPETKTWNQY